MKQNLSKISKKISFVLRHHPEQIGVRLDPYGRANLAEFLAKFHQHYQIPINKQLILKIIQQSTKQRFAIEGPTIRALYGHSLPVTPLAPAAKPPVILYHGTSPEAAKVITASGLKKMDRAFVHLSEDQSSAQQVGRRHDPHPVILTIQARKAARTGLLFYPTKSGIWLADYVPAKFITVQNKSTSGS
ncbi:RNA 2'-phosphotransferase [Ligilactobacillus salitolerans]|uniref:Probable RNA 2'-phosphotransferase n=1 Tax=Ligilactobacillus salitolerans TaxID=1808352 RepID=A0A401IQ69_9LACO|nr:RNA 2'-phosphotransferase [Ligilactobacillus salitolerans]GBG93689.1 RNA 2'-phosphotransferase [Ligilactobacillus salitolerans]